MPGALIGLLFVAVSLHMRTFTDDQRWLLEKELRQVEWLEGQVELLEKEIERRVVIFEDAIQRHQREGALAQRGFIGLRAEDRQRLLAFLRSL